MKAIIYIEAKNALLKGLDNYEDYTIEFDPQNLTQEQREELARSEMENGVFTPCVIRYSRKSYGVVTPDIDALRTILNGRIADRLKEEAEEKKRKTEDNAKYAAMAKEWLAIPDMECLLAPSWNNKRWEIKSYQSITHGIIYNFSESRFLEEPGAQEKYDHLKAMISHLQAEHEAKEAEQKKTLKQKEAEKAAEEAAAAERRRAQIDAWVADHGTDNQKARHAEGLLSEEEVKDHMRDALYAPLADWPRYEKIKSADFCECEYDSAPDYDVDIKPSATAEEFDQLQEIRKLMPSAIVELREHTGNCEDCGQTLSHTGFMVRLTSGEFEFSREYALKE